ncbi:succinoglycan biosynthesis protein ExoM [Methylorubrum rhodinum]|uniref:Succinoglycan biosynthesis protein ExoM n=1 Tax=Methylorubrum rhodinum TaxID=29428 RepID=A0A840ZT88_9HYPH|nr:glycosyltransferase family 2 protein [Methylorubrum rhodinum]MBB5760255.1 succinoglycan biosynthesis protein ExoM [Methylorubrum rhodinum]
MSAADQPEAPAATPPSVVTTVSVVICTFNRPTLLARAVRTAREQRLPPDVAAEIVVVDNAPDGNAGPVVAALSGEAGLPLRYLAHPVPNISHARNRGVAGTKGALVVFLDDDEWCRPGWLAALVATARETGADIVFGAVLPDFPDGPPDWDPSGRPFERRLDRPSGTRMGIRHDSGASGRWIGTGNALLRRDTCLVGDAPFDPWLGRSGGEDHDLFVRLDRAGRRMVWCGEAVVYEVVPAERTRFDYMLLRNRRGGQQWASVAVRRARRPALAAVSIALRASVQLALVSAAWAASRLRGAPDAGARRLKVAQVAGKLLWWTMPRGHR